MTVPFNISRISIIFIIITIGLISAGAYFILSGQSSSCSPGVNFTSEIRDSSVYITHSGGGPLFPGNLMIVLDGSELGQESIHLLPDDEWPFSIGKTLVIPCNPGDASRTLDMYYTSGNSQCLIFSTTIPPEAAATVHPSPSPTPEATVLPVTPEETDSPQPTPVSTPGKPEARFTASPRTGPLPLTVTFSDLSTGVPDSWAWEFGDGEGSGEQNPVHTYTEVGTYTVSLQVRNDQGAHTRIMQGFVNVTPAEVLDVAIFAETEGFIRPGGFAQFHIAGPGSRIKIGGQEIRPEAGDTLRLVLESDGRGSISIMEGQVTDFSFDDVRLYINGRDVAGGDIMEIFIPSSNGFLSTFILEIPPSEGEYRVKVGGVTEILSGNENVILVKRLRPDSYGMILLDTSLPYSVQYRGGAGSISY